MRHPLLESVLSTALVCALSATVLPAPAPATPAPASPTKTLKAVPNFTTVTDQAMRAPRPVGLADVSRQLSGLGLQPARADQQDERQDAAARLVARDGAGHQPGDAASSTTASCISRNPSDVIQAIDAATGDLIWEYKHPLPPDRDVPERRRDSASAASRSMATASSSSPGTTIVVALDARTGEQVWQTDRGGDLYVTQLERPDRRQRRRRCGQHLSTSLWAGVTSPATMLKPWSRALAQRVDPAPWPARRRDVGRLAVREPLAHGSLGLHLTYDPDLDLVFYGSSGVSRRPPKRNAKAW